MLSIVIPSYNQERTIAESIESALIQDYEDKEILVVDDCSTDRTVSVVKRYPVRLIQNAQNIGIGHNLIKCMEEARGTHVIYLCGDDIFTCKEVCSDYMEIFKRYPEMGVIGHYFYQFMDGYPGAIITSRDEHILTSSCNPSGMAFLRDKYEPTTKIFVEMPFIVKQAVERHRWSHIIKYDTIAVRIHPGGNTGTKEWYYTESPMKNWTDLVGKDYTFFPIFIQIKNRAPKMLWREVCTVVRITPKCLLYPSFWFYLLISLSVPSWMLRRLSNFYRHRITRIFARIIERPSK